MTTHSIALTILVPVLNEMPLLDDLFRRLAPLCARYPSQLELILCDGGSRDGSFELMHRNQYNLPYTLVAAPAKKPSVARTLAPGVMRANGSFILVLPADCELEPKSLAPFFEEAAPRRMSCGGFLKVYEPGGFVLNLYAWLQNRIRVGMLRHLVWTNALFWKRGLLSMLPQDGFLEDVMVSDFLRQQKGWRALHGPVIVSSRRYYPHQVFERILLNLRILYLYRTGKATIQQLSEIYHQSKGPAKQEASL
jgi:glycosyltransferase involved in cell wall biosynthesis